ncbi:MAG: hypothetical protein ACOX3V_04860 [Bacillota bacterium]
MTVLQKEVAQPQVVIQPDGRINIPKKEDGSVWTLEELREKMKWSRWPMFDELEPLFPAGGGNCATKTGSTATGQCEELMEMKDIQQFLGLESS